MPYKPKSKESLRKRFNNIFVKDVPKSSDTEEGVKKLFEPYGRISSLLKRESDKGTIYFVCFDSADSEDREYGPRCAEKACAEMHGK